MEKVRVNKDVCIGCGSCQSIAPDIFSLNDEGYAEAIEDKIPEDLIDDTIDALESCPTSAIEEVTDEDDE